MRGCRKLCRHQARGGVPSQVCWSTSYWRWSGQARCGPWRAYGSCGSSSGAWCSGSAGSMREVRAPGLTRIHPGVDRFHRVNMQIVTMPVPAQDGITRDNVTVKVDAVVYFKVIDPVRAIVDVQDYRTAIGQVAQTSLRSIIGKSDLDDLLSNRERLNQGLELMIDSPALGWGVHIDRVEIKDVALPESMKRSMSRQAEAERERRARVISAEGELQASEKLALAAAAMSRHPGCVAAAAAGDGGPGGVGEELDAGAAVPGGAAAVPGVQHHTSRRGGRKRPGGGGTVPACRSFRGGARVRSAHPDDGGARLPGGGAKPESAHPDIVGDARVDTSERNTDGRLDALTASAASGSSPIPASDTPAGRPRDSVRSTRAPSRTAGPLTRIPVPQRRLGHPDRMARRVDPGRRLQPAGPADGRRRPRRRRAGPAAAPTATGGADQRRTTDRPRPPAAHISVVKARPG